MSSPRDDLDGLADWLRENCGYDGYGNDPRWERWATAVEALTRVHVDPFTTGRLELTSDVTYNRE